MPNKFLFCFIFLFCFGIHVFSQNTIIEKETIASFIDNSYWYQKYLPLENIAQYLTIRNRLINAEASDSDRFDRLCNTLDPQIQDLYSKAYRVFQKEIAGKNFKMDELLNSQYGSYREIRELFDQYTGLKESTDSGFFSNDDACLDKIEEYHSRYITRANYSKTNKNKYTIYIVEEGDYLRKIAEKIHGDERQWQSIYLANKDNKALLPYLNNPDLIYPGAEIRIPQPEGE